MAGAAQSPKPPAAFQKLHCATEAHVERLWLVF